MGEETRGDVMDNSHNCHRLPDADDEDRREYYRWMYEVRERHATKIS